MRELKIGDFVIFNNEVESFVFKYIDFTFNQEYIILDIHNDDNDNVICTLNSDIGAMKGVNYDFLSLSPIYRRNEVIDDILK